jgi:hypothetical protein
VKSASTLWPGAAAIAPSEPGDFRGEQSRFHWLWKIAMNFGNELPQPRIASAKGGQCQRGYATTAIGIERFDFADERI